MVRKFILLGALVFAPLEAVNAHPLHMSFTEVRRIHRSGSVELSIRVFADDFSTAAARYSRARLDSSQIIDSRRAFAYTLAKIRLSHTNGAAVALVPCGVTKVGVMLHLCLRSRVASSEPLKIANTMMTDLFSDQVNVVQSVDGRSRTSRMFVKGDTWKPLS